MSDDDKRVIFRTILDNFLSSGFEGSLTRFGGLSLELMAVI